MDDRRALSLSILLHLSVLSDAAGFLGVFGLGSGNDTRKKTPAAKPPARVQSKDRDMGSALRSVYEKTVREEVPSDLLDLLGKLD